MIKPTIGRVVWYFPAPGDHLLIDREPLTALVCGVISDERINLAVFDRNGEGSTSRRGVLLIQGDPATEMPEEAFAAWMPYQKGQAAKHEAAVKEG